ncbi:Rhodanese-like domain-containing protein [Podospora australis]|uniref:Rhodanese-like domain-containing protein n=1 Tax=Podospora australis TaxID=1536484 RepID=A0AAN7AF57_9PEZI|nr:Rhodanese-like domain-containing protein [Podospora australis]
MIGSSLLALAAAISSASAAAVGASKVEERAITPLACLFFGDVVSPWWLNKCAPHLDLVVIDLRSAEEYAASHIPGSISAPFDPISAWSQMGPGDLLLELPEYDTLASFLGSIGVGNTAKVQTKIVLVNGVAVPAFPQAASPRVATTLKFAGLSEGRVAILDGGFPTWEAESLPVTTVVPTPSPKTFTSAPDRSFLVDIEYVKSKINKRNQGIFLIDGRDQAVYNGSAMEDWALKPGHIPSALNLPAQKIWNSDGSFKSTFELLALVRQTIGYSASRSYGEIIVYCGVGGYASSWYFVFTRILGFGNNVKFFDGSAQQWSQFYDMEL